MTSPQPPARMSDRKSKIAFGVSVFVLLAAIVACVLFSRESLFVFIAAGIAGFFAVLKEYVGFYSTNFDPGAKERWDKLAAFFGVLAAVIGVPSVVAGLIQIAEAAK